jgi:hypothetical protein
MALISVIDFDMEPSARIGSAVTISRMIMVGIRKITQAVFSPPVFYLINFAVIVKTPLELNHLPWSERQMHPDDL